MYCPQCGQITININDKDICTTCGIVFSDDVPQKQVLGQIKSKISEKKKSTEAKEAYVSPMEGYLKKMLLEAEGKVAAEKQTPNVAIIQKQTPPITKEKTIAELSAEESLTVGRDNDREVPSVEKTLQSFEIKPAKGISVPELAEGSKSVLTHLPRLQSEDSNREPVSKLGHRKANPLGNSFQTGSVPDAEEHNLLHIIRPTFIKALFYILFFIFLSGSGYFIYKNHVKLLEGFNNISIYVGESLFKQ